MLAQAVSFKAKTKSAEFVMTRWGNSYQIDRKTLHKEFIEYEKIVIDEDFQRKLRIYQKLSHRNANIFSIFLSNLDWDKGARNTAAVFDLANGFFPFVEREVQSFFSEMDKHFRQRLEKRKQKDGVYFQYAMNSPAYPQMGFNLWYLIGDSFPISIDEMILETRLLIALWQRYTETEDFLGLACVIFDEITVGEMETPEFGRYHGGAAFELAAKESSFVISDNQAELKKISSSLILCDSRTSYLLFNCFIGRDFENKDGSSKFRIMATYDLKILSDPKANGS